MSLAEVQARIAVLQQMFPPPAVSSRPGAGNAFSAALRVAQSPASGDVAAGGAGQPSGDDVVRAARKYLGVPYVWGGTNPATGLDCSGLVQKVFSEFGIEVPRVSRDQARAGTAVPNLAAARPGDLVAFGSPVDHIGIYAGNNTMVVAPRSGDVVKVQEITRTPTAIRRILPDAGSAAELGSSNFRAAASAAAGSVGPLPASLRSAAGAQYAPLFAAAGSKYGVPPALLAAVAKAESSFNPRAVSPAGARGLMQIMPGTARELGVDPMDPRQAVDGAARLLASHLKTFGSPALALAAYNAGPGAVRKYDGIPPYAETQNYVRRVLSYAGDAA